MISRPVVLIPVWGFCALGFRRAVYNKAGIGLIECWNATSFFIYSSIILFSLSVAAVYVMNQIADIDADKKNGGMPLIASGIVSIPSAILMAVLFSLFSILYSLFFRHTTMLLAVVTTLLLGYIYSFRPLRLSGRPFADFISNATGYGIIAFGIGWFLGGRSPYTLQFLNNALPYFFLMCAGSISSTLPDYYGDREDNKCTTAVAFGILPAHILAMVFLISAATTGILQNDTIVSICAFTSLPAYLLFFIRRTKLFMEATYKIGGAICMIASFTALPLFILLALVVFLATWLYFRIRHGIAYPSLVPVKTSH